MNKAFFLFIFLSLFFFACQEKKGEQEDALKNRATELAEAVKAKNIANIRNLIYPKFLNIFPKAPEQFSLEPVYLGEEISMIDVSIDSLYPIIEVNGNYYTLASFKAELKLPVNYYDRLESAQFIDTIGDQVYPRAYPAPQFTLMSTLLKEYGIDLIDQRILDSSKHVSFRIVTITLKDDSVKDWTFVTLQNSQSIYESFIPREALKRLSTYTLRGQD